MKQLKQDLWEQVTKLCRDRNYFILNCSGTFQHFEINEFIYLLLFFINYVLFFIIYYMVKCCFSSPTLYLTLWTKWINEVKEDKVFVQLEHVYQQIRIGICMLAARSTCVLCLYLFKQKSQQDKLHVQSRSWQTFIRCLSRPAGSGTGGCKAERRRAHGQNWSLLPLLSEMLCGTSKFRMGGVNSRVAARPPICRAEISTCSPCCGPGPFQTVIKVPHRGAFSRRGPGETVCCFSSCFCWETNADWSTFDAGYFNYIKTIYL